MVGSLNRRWKVNRYRSGPLCPLDISPKIKKIDFGGEIGSQFSPIFALRKWGDGEARGGRQENSAR